MSVLRIEARDDRLSVMLWNDVSWQQALSALWRVRNAGDRRPTLHLEVSALQDRHVFGHDWRRSDARMRAMRRALGRGGCFREDLRRSRRAISRCGPGVTHADTSGGLD